MRKPDKGEIFTIPNLLSCLRILLIPFYIRIYQNATSASHYYIAGAVLTLSCITDWFDGWIARRFQMSSKLGRVLDPIADKGTQLALLISISIHRKSLRFLLYLFLIKESFQLVAAVLMLKKGKILTGALPTGKIATAALFAGLILIVTFPSLYSALIAGITLLCGFLMLVAFLEYALTYLIHEEAFERIKNKKKAP